MNRFESLARRLVLSWALALGCGEGTTEPGGPGPSTTSPPPAADDPVAVYAALSEDMARLRALEVVEVGWLKMSPEAPSCYGIHPCETLAAVPEVAAEYARQAPRLDRLASIGEQAAAGTYASGESGDVAADLALLNALEIVELRALITEAPANNPSCYNLPCPEDVARADAENARRRAVLHAFAAEAAAVRP